MNGMGRHVVLATIVSAFLVSQKSAWADPPLVLNKRVAASTDDAEEAGGGTIALADAIISTGGSNAWVGMRFQSITIPKNATILGAYVTFQAASNDSSNPAACTLFAQATNDASAFTTTTGNISARQRTTASLALNPIPAFFDNMPFSSPDITPLIQEVVDRSGWASGNDLAIIIRSDGSGPRSVDSFDGSSTTAPLLHIEYTPYSRPVAPDLLMVVQNPASLTAQEAIRREWLQWWAYRVTLIDDSATQAAFDAAVAASDVAYVSQEAQSTEVSTKLKSARIGVVVEEDQLYDEAALTTTPPAYVAANSFQVAANTHYITSPFALGLLPLFSSSQTGMQLTGTVAPEGVSLGTWSGGGKGLLTVEAGGMLADGTRAAGRRVGLPWGSGTLDFNALNADGRTIFRRSIEWAAGLVGHWKLDETTGATLYDSSVNLNHATLYNNTIAASYASPAKVDGGMRFDGLNDYSQMPDKACLQLTKALTISAWVKGDAWSSGDIAGTVLRKGMTNPNSYSLGICDGRVALQLEDYDAAGVRGNTTLQTGKWHHVAASWDGSQVCIYVDGKLDNTPVARTGPLALDTREVYLGGRNGSDTLNGVLDDVRLFNYALTPAEVKTVKGISQPHGVRITKWVEIK